MPSFIQKLLKKPDLLLQACVCEPLHIDCDAKKCQTKARGKPSIQESFAAGYNNVTIRATRMQLELGAERAKCQTCAFILNAINPTVYQPGCRWLLSRAENDERLFRLGFSRDLELKFNEDMKVEVDRTGRLKVDVGWEIRLEILPDDSMGETTWGCRAFALAKMPIDSTSSDQSFRDLEGWIEQCSYEHPSCQPSIDAPLPTRVLVVNQEKIFLHETRGRTEKAPYIALSYCWGLRDFVKCTPSTLDSLKREIKWDTLPKTFQDAITITRRLGIMYLWIDALCIIQGDKYDWHKESEQMGSIYRNAYLTIAASHAPSSYQGCFADTMRREASKLRPITPFERQGRSGFSVRKELDHYNFLHDVSDEPLGKRGWTLQERLLSKRIVHYTAQEIIWECEESSKCQCSRLQTDKFESTKISVSRALNVGVESIDLVLQWIHIIEDYSRRKMTYESDRLIGLSGLAKVFVAAGCGDYVAGFFRQHIVELMVWNKTQDENALRSASNVAYLGPSWSWVSVKSPVSYYAYKGGGPFACWDWKVKVEDLQWQCATADPTGSLMSAHVTIKGVMVAAKSAFRRMKATFRDTEEDTTVLQQLDAPHCILKWDDYDNLQGHMVDTEVYCVLWALKRYSQANPRVESSMFLVLKKSERFPGAYERLGLARVPWHYRGSPFHFTNGSQQPGNGLQTGAKDFFAGASEQSIKIV